MAISNSRIPGCDEDVARNWMQMAHRRVQAIRIELPLPSCWHHAHESALALDAGSWGLRANLLHLNYLALWRRVAEDVPLSELATLGEMKC